MGNDELLKFWLGVLVIERRNIRLFLAQFFVPVIFSLLAVYVFTQTSWSKFDGSISSEFVYTDIIRRSDISVSPLQVFYHNCNVLYDAWKYVKHFDVQCLEHHYMSEISSFQPDQTFVVIDNFNNYTHELAFRIINLSYKLKKNLYSPWSVLSLDLRSDIIDENDGLISYIQEGIVEGLSRYLELNIYNTRKYIVAMPVFKFSLMKAYHFLALVSIGVCSPAVWHFISLYQDEEECKGKHLLNDLKIVKMSTYVLSHFLLYSVKFFVVQLLFWLPIFIYNSKFLDVHSFLISSTLISFNLTAFCLSVCSTFRSRHASGAVLFGLLLACGFCSFGWNDFLPASPLTYITTLFFPVAYQAYMRITANSIMSDKFRKMSYAFSVSLVFILIFDCLLMLMWTMFREKAFLRKKKSPSHRLKLSTSAISDTRIPLMELSDVRVTRRQEKLLSEINLSIHKEEITAFHGKGSLELLQTIRGDVECTGSTFVFDGTVLGENKIISCSKDLYMLPYLTVMEHIELLIRARQAENVDYYEMMDVLGLVSIGHLFHHGLKNNDKHLLKVMFTFLSNASIILLDEPFSCDVTVHAQLNRFLRKQKTGRAIVFTCNSLSVASRIADSLVLLANGEVWRQLSSSECRKESQVLILWSRLHLDAAQISAIKKKVCACLGSKFKGRLVSDRQPKGVLTFKAPSISLIKYTKLLKLLKTEQSLGIENCELKISTPIDDYIRFCNVESSPSCYSYSIVDKMSKLALCTVLPDLSNIIDLKLKFFSQNSLACLLSFALPPLLSILVSILSNRSPLNKGYINTQLYMQERENSYFFVTEKEEKNMSSYCSYLTEHLQYNFGAVQRGNVTYLCYYATSIISELFLNQIWQSLFYKDFKVNVTIETVYSPKWRYLIDAFDNSNNLAGIPLPVISLAISDNWLEILAVGLNFLLCVSHITTFTRETSSFDNIGAKKPLQFWLTSSLVDFLIFVSLITVCTTLVVFPHHGVFVSLLTISSSSIALISSLPFIYMISAKSDDSLSACFSSFQLLGGLLLPSIFSLFSSPFGSQFEASISLIFSLSTIFPPIVPALITGLSATYRLQGRRNFYILKQLFPLYLISFMPVWTWVFIALMNRKIIPKIKSVVESIHSKCWSSLRKSNRVTA
ncbi:unnamed protein product [Auanema sp. JU1783]|nr:unnamed protein product [Auanema sp. JU1783]